MKNFLSVILFFLIFIFTQVAISDSARYGSIYCYNGKVIEAMSINFPHYSNFVEGTQEGESIKIPLATVNEIEWLETDDSEGIVITKDGKHYKLTNIKPRHGYASTSFEVWNEDTNKWTKTTRTIIFPLTLHSGNVGKNFIVKIKFRN